MLTIFHYPKNKHTRTLKPRIFKRHKSYKKYLQYEFSRVCVYCRQPDSSAPNLNFGVDHYKPQGLSRFAHLACDYSNLFYSCSNCNSRKNAYWPIDEEKGPYIPNPCSHIMSEHLTYDSTNGKVKSKSEYGTFTIDLLQLNDQENVKYRVSTCRVANMCLNEISNLERQKADLTKKLNKNEISVQACETEINQIDQDIIMLNEVYEKETGKKPLKPLRTTKMGVSVLS